MTSTSRGRRGAGKRSERTRVARDASVVPGASSAGDRDSDRDSDQDHDTGEVLTLVVPPELSGQRLDRALCALAPVYSRSRAQEAIKEGYVCVGGRPAKPSLLVEAGQQITVHPPAKRPTTRNHAGDVPPLDVVFEDEHLLVVNKPPGLVMHPAPGHESGTLVDALRAHVPGLDAGEDATRPGIVHRLDKDTSGLLVVAKTAPAHAALSTQMKERRMVKCYLALVEGAMPVPEGAIEAPIGRDLRQRQKMGIVATTRGGREARTRFRVLRAAHGRSLLEVQLETGRTHQIRVHLAAVQHPVVGDERYGRPQPPLPPRIFLHAAHLEFAHPITGEWMAFEAPLPPDLATFLDEWERGLA